MAINPALMGLDPAAMAGQGLPPMPGMPQGIPGMPDPMAMGVQPMQQMTAMPQPIQGGDLGMPTGGPQMGGPPPGPPPEPLLFIPEYLLDEIAERNLERENALVEKAAEALGPPSGTESYSVEDQIAMYLSVPADLVDERTREERVAQLRAEGKTEDEVMDAIYPLRRILFKMAASSPGGVLSYARRIHKLAMARLNNLPEPEDPWGDDEYDEDEESDDDTAYDDEEDE